jgi:hypothetical protein
MAYEFGNTVTWNSEANSQLVDYSYANGFAFEPQTDAEGIKVKFNRYTYSFYDSVDNLIELRDTNGNTLDSIVTNFDSESTHILEAPLDAFTEYIVQVGGNGNYYEMGFAEYFEAYNDNLVITSGASGGEKSSPNIYAFDEATLITTKSPSKPQNQSVSYDSSTSETTLTFDSPSNWGGDVGSYDIDVSINSGSYQDPNGMPSNTTNTSLTETVSSGNTYKYRVRATNSAGDSAWVYTSTIETVGIPSSPNSISLVVNSNASIHLTVDPPNDWNGEVGNYDIQMERDGSGYNTPHGGPDAPSGSTSTQTYNYGPSSDSQYQRQVGIDSSFKFRVRATNSAGASGWTYSGKVYTQPTPPKNISVSRPDPSTVRIHGTVGSEFGDYIQVKYREDTGGGYGPWTRMDNAVEGSSYIVSGSVTGKGNTFTIEYDVGTAYQYETLQQDARYQFSVQHRYFNDKVNNIEYSDEIYTDYGNEGNVFFEDDFESGDLSNWDSSNLGGSDAGVQSGAGDADLTIGGADEGTYYFYGEGINSTEATWVQKNLGDLSNETDVLVKCAFATASMDSNAETFGISWYDGSSWQPLKHFSWEYNRQGWYEVSVVVPSSYLSSDNRIRVGTTTSDGMFGGDHFAVDRVVVSDILHEYTKPAAPSGLSLDKSVEREITGSWTINCSLTNTEPFFQEWRRAESGNTLGKQYPAVVTSYTDNNLKDGEKYDIRVDSLFEQPRQGSVSNYWRATSSLLTTTTILPSETPSASTASSTSVDVSWSDIWNNENGIRVDYSTDGGATWTQFSDLPAGTVSETVTGLPDDTECQFRIEPYTEHVSKNSPSATASTFLGATRTVTSYGSGSSSVETLIDLGVSASSSSSPGRSLASTIIDLGESVNSHLSGTDGSGSRGSASYGNRTSTSYSSEIKFTVYNERTSLEILDYNIDWDEGEVAWYTEWFQEPTIMGNEDVLALRSLVVPDAKDPTATITVQYDKSGSGTVDEESDPIDTGQSEETHEVRSIPIEDNGWYRMKITNYTGYNEIYSLDIGRVR